jgi:glyoxylase-like metal-dependent hydrolase (beta-lactamase superfamily II)
MNIVDLTPNLRMLELENPGQAYLLRRGDQVILVDTGTAGQESAIAEGLRDWGLDRDSLTHVLLTHWHPDHVGSAAAVGAWPNAEVWAHQGDAPVIAGEQPGAFPVLTPAEEGFYAQAVGQVPEADPVRIDRRLTDDEVLPEISARVISAPGHTDGSIAFYFPDDRVLFTGDVATMHEGQVMLGPFNADRARARESFRRFADVDVDVVCFGHGEPLLGSAVHALLDAVRAPEVSDPLG